MQQTLLIFSGFLHEFFPAAGTGNGNLSLSSGYPHHLTALGAVEIPVLPVLDPAHQLQELPVLLIALISIPGQGPENGPEHHAVA